MSSVNYTVGCACNLFVSVHGYLVIMTTMKVGDHSATSHFNLCQRYHVLDSLALWDLSTWKILAKHIHSYPVLFLIPFAGPIQ